MPKLSTDKPKINLKRPEAAGVCPAVESLLGKIGQVAETLTQEEIKTLSNGGAAVIGVNHTGEIVITKMNAPIKITMDSEKSYDACVEGEPTGVYLDIRDYGVSTLDVEGDFLETDEDGNNYKDMY